MLTKTIEVDVVKKTFPNDTIPPHLACPLRVDIDVAQALFMLGQLTSPSGFSSASPTLYWAWLRYFSAISRTPDLRITGAFADLDPHQKTILSDDIGVAICTKWLYDRLGGFAEIVDGRRFLLQYASLTRRPKRKTPKVGIGKCPDYVVRDFADRWHVIECKGTQSDRAYRNRQLQAAYMQKQVIDIRGAARGDRLAAGVYLGNEREDHSTHLRVIDPEPEPYVVINESNREAAALASHRLAVARALALAGYEAISEELYVPEASDGLTELYTPSERIRLAQPAPDRWKSAYQSLRTPERRAFHIGAERYLGKEISISIPGDDFKANTQCTRIKIVQGIREDFIDELQGITGEHFDAIGNASERYLADTGIRMRSDGPATTLHEGSLYAARMEFLT